MTQTTFMDCAGVVWRSTTIDEANASLVAWGHKMGPMNRPDYGDLTAQGLYHDGAMVAVACTAGLVRAAVGNLPWLTRGNAIELARLCAVRPGLCRVALRLWREFTFPGTGAGYAVSYQDADLHTGNLYRFDGWARMSFNGEKGADKRSGRPGRNLWVWVWPPPATEVAP